MRHAGAHTIAALEPLLGRLRTLPGLAERTPGVFYRRSRAFLHFHEDPAGLFADVRLADEFERHRVSTDAEQAGLVAFIERALTKESDDG